MTETQTDTTLGGLLVRRASSMTARNHHIEARLYVIEHGLSGKAWSSLEDSYKALRVLRDHFGYMPAGMSEVEGALDRQLKAAIKSEYSDRDAARIWEAL
jgi:hypothetical protein